MRARPGVGCYRALLHLYPRRFRAEYGPDMVLLFANQLRDESAARVWARAVVDVAISVPTQHLEAHMDRPASPLVPLLFVVVSLTAVVVALIAGVELIVDADGSSRGVFAVGLFAAVTAALAVASWRHTRPVATAGRVTAHWWKFLAGGAGILAAVIITATATGEVPGALWWPMMITLLAGLLLAITGLVLGVAHRLGSRLLGNPPG